MKIYARQIPPEYQESPLMYVDEGYDEIICDGNRNYESRTTDEYDTIRKYIDEAATHIEDIKTSYAYSTITEMINDLFCRCNKKPYNKREIHEWKEILLRYQNCKSPSDENEIMCRILELMTNKPHTYKCIRGCCQSDWQYIYYPAGEYSDEFIKCFEADYFNMGTEWEIHDEKTEPASPEEINGYCMYCYSWDDDGIRDEIAKEAGVTVDNVILYKFERYTQVPIYSAV